MVKKAKKSKNIVTINWEEEEGGKFIQHPGEYVVKAISAEQNEDDEGKSYIKWTFQVTSGKGKGSTISTSTFITPKALWKLRELLECMGIEIGNSVQNLDLDEAIEEGSEFVIEVEEGNERADGKGYYMQVSDFMPLDDYEEASSNMNKKEESDDEEDDETEEEEPVSKGSKKSKKEDKEEPKSKKSKSKEVDEEDLLDQMEEEIDELGLDIDLDDYDTFAEKKKAFEKAKAAATEESEEEDEEEEEQVYTVEEIEALGTKQLKLIAEEIGLELDEEASTRSKRRSVIAGLRKAGKLDE